MNLRTWNLKWVAAFAAAALVGAVGVVAALTVVGGGDNQATAGEDETRAIPTAKGAATDSPSTPGPSKPEQPSYPAVIPTLPPDFTFPEKQECPLDWGQITDDMAGYSICVPPGWGVADPSTGERTANMVLHYGEAFIYSPEAFPRPLGKTAEAPLEPQADFVTIALFPITTDTSVEGGCETKPGDTVAGLPAVTCEYRFDPEPYWDQAIISPSGAWAGLRVFVPLPNAKPPTGPDGQALPTAKGEPPSAALGISVFARNEVMDGQRDTITEILATLQILP